MKCCSFYFSFSTFKSYKWDSQRSARWNQDAQREEGNPKQGGVADKIAADHSNLWGKLPTPEVKVTEHQYPHPFQFCLPNVMQL